MNDPMSPFLRAEGARLLRPLNQAPAAACNCIGPQDGAPACPCMMRSVQVVNGRYVRITDLGPAPPTAHEEAASKVLRHAVVQTVWQDFDKRKE